MRDRDVLAIASSMGLYDRKLGFIEISPEELLEFAHAIEQEATKHVVTKLHTLVEKLA